MKKKFVVLAADDDANDLRLLHKAISGDGLEVQLMEVHNGEELIQYLSNEGPFADCMRFPKPDLLLLDLKMPRVDGLQVLDWLAQHPEHAQLPKVMLSGSGLERDVEEAYRRGANTYFTKPTDFNHFQKLVRLTIDYWTMSERPGGRNGQS